jgi:hypothetical protein
MRVHGSGIFKLAPIKIWCDAAPKLEISPLRASAIQGLCGRHVRIDPLVSLHLFRKIRSNPNLSCTGISGGRSLPPGPITLLSRMLRGYEAIRNQALGFRAQTHRTKLCFFNKPAADAIPAPQFRQSVNNFPLS